MKTGLGRIASKAFGPRALKIPWIYLGRIRGSKPGMGGTTWVPFWIYLGDGSAIVGSAKIKGAKPSTVGMVYPFFGAGAPESIDDSVISSITTEVEGAGGILNKGSRKYPIQSFLDPIEIALWLVATWVFRGHRLAAMHLLLHTDSLLIQMIQQSARL